MHLSSQSPDTLRPFVLVNPHGTNIDSGNRYIERLDKSYPDITVVRSEKDLAGTEAALIDGINSSLVSTGFAPNRLIVISGDGVLGQTVNAIDNVRAKGKNKTETEEILANGIVLQLIAAGNGCDGHREYLSSRRFNRPPMPDQWPYIRELYPLRVTAVFPNAAKPFQLDVANYIGGGISAELMDKMHDARLDLASKSRVNRLLQEYTIARAIREEHHTIIVNGQELSDWTLAKTRRMAKLALTGTSHEETGFRELLHEPFSTRMRFASLLGKLILQRPLNGVTHTDTMKATFGSDVPVHINGDFMGVWPMGTVVTASIVPEPILIASTRRTRLIDPTGSAHRR